MRSRRPTITWVPSMDKPLHLSDSQLEQILRAAAPLAPNDRSPFLADVAAALRGQALGDGTVFRVISGTLFSPARINPGRVGEIWALNGLLGRLPSAAHPYCAGAALSDPQGYEVYCPRLRERRVLRGRRVESPSALFPGYAFLRVVAGWWQARWTHGTCGLVMDGATPAKVPDAVIAEIRSSERQGAIELSPKLRPGHRLRVVRGPFRDQLAIYAGMSERDRVAVLPRLLGGRAPDPSVRVARRMLFTTCAAGSFSATSSIHPICPMGAEGAHPSQSFHVICKCPEFGSTALTAAVAAPELVQRGGQHDRVRPAWAIRNPCAAVVACWPGIEAKLPRQLEDRGFMAALRRFRRQCVALQLLGDCSHDVRQFVARQKAWQIWRSWELVVNPCTHERVQKPRRRFTLHALAWSASDTAASYFGLDPGGIAALSGVQVLPGSFLGISGYGPQQVLPVITD
jgi:transcriptional antiterminator RfaH